MHDETQNVHKVAEARRASSNRSTGATEPARESAAAKRAAGASSSESSGHGSRASQAAARTTSADRVEVSRDHAEATPASRNRQAGSGVDHLTSALAGVREERQGAQPAKDSREVPEGARIQRSSENGQDVVTTSYEKDGAQIHEVEKTRPDGTVVTVSTVEKDGVTERTESTTTLSDQPIEELRPELADSEALNSDLAEEGQRDQTEITHVTRTVTDTTKNPPVTRTALDSTTYSQHIPLGDQEAEATGLSTSALSPGAQPYYGRYGSVYAQRPDALEGVQIDRSESGVTLACSTTTTTDASGRSQTSTESGSTSTITGTKDGREVQLTEATARVTGNGKTREAHSLEMRGLLQKGGEGSPSVEQVGSLKNKDDYRDRLPDGSVNFRQTDVFDVTEDGKLEKVSGTQEYGDYDNPLAAGRAVTISEKGDQKQWTYRQVDDTAAGIRVRSQTGAEGSNGYLLEDGTYNEDGTYHSEMKVVDNDGVTTRQEIHDRSLVQPEDLTAEGGFPGDAAYAREFVQDNQGRRIFRDKAVVVDSKDDFKDCYNLQRFTAEGSQDRLTNVFRTGDRSNTTILENPGSDVPARMRTDGGTEFQIDRVGQSYLLKDGKKVAIPADPALDGGPSPEGLADSSGGAFKNLFGAVKNLGTSSDVDLTTLADVRPGVAGGIGGLSILVGGASIYQSVVEKDPGAALSGSSNIASGLGDLSSLGAKAVSSTRLTAALGVGGKALGAAGAVLGAGYGIYQIAQGDTVGGAFSLAAAAGTGLAVGASIAGVTGWVPVAGWAVAGVAIVGGVVYDLWKSDQEAHQTAELQF